jgi:thiol-disulfide isomerase/thioredoxin
MFIRALPILAAVLFVSAPASAAATLDRIALGTYVSGPTVTAKQLTGRVVLFEYWGVHCPPCLASIAHLVEMQHKYGRDNFIIVANQCQGGDEAGARAAWTSHGGDASISVINNGELAGSNVSAIPHCFLFDQDGKLVYDGSPFNVADKLDLAMKSNPGALVVGHAYTRTAKQAAAIGALKTNLGPTLKSLRGLAAGSDATAKEEAGFLLGRVGTYAQDQLASITGQRAKDPLATSTALARMLEIFKGDELGQPFEALYGELKADKAFQSEVKAAALLADIEAQGSKLGLGSDATPPRSALVELAQRIQSLQKSFPDSAAAARSKQLVATWKL